MFNFKTPASSLFKEVSKECNDLDIGFHLESGSPPDIITDKFLNRFNIGLVVADFSPLRYFLIPQKNFIQKIFCM